MKTRSRAACLSAAVAAVTFGLPAVARDLQWDWNPGLLGPQEGSGNWDTTTPNWIEGGVNVTWNNTTPDSAFFGNGGDPVGEEGGPIAFPYFVNVPGAMAVQNITLNEVASGYSYDIGGPGSLTLHGNLIKNIDNGQVNFFVNTTLTAGNHTVTMRDTGGDVIEFLFNGGLEGPGNLIIDNAGYEAWGTIALQQPNAGYTGATTITKGRVVLTNGQGLGSTAAASGTSIGEIGTLALYGAGAPFNGDMTVAEPITITRSKYSEFAGLDPANVEYGRYNGAIQSNNGNNTITGPVTLNTVDARVQVNGGANSLTISSNITQTSPSRLSKSGDGVLFLTGTNTYTGGTASHNGTVAFTTDANIGGASSPMFFNGGYFRVPATWTNFGAHPIDNTEFAGGLDTPGATQVFLVNENLTGTNFNKRGVGTVNLNGTNVFSSDNFTDLGTVNVNASTTARAIRIRNGTVNINSGGTYTTTGQWTSIGNDGGENGTLNLNGTGYLRAGFNPTTNAAAPQDFNVSDNPNSTGTFNVNDQAQADIYGTFFVAKNTNTNATVNQNGTSTINQRGNVVLGQGGTATGTFNKNAGALNIISGELWVGNNGGGTGTFTQTAGTTTINNWVAIGRNTSTGTMNLNGGTFTKTGGGNVEIDFGGGGNGTLNVRNNALLDVQGGELWVGQSGGSNGQLNVQDSGQVKINNWFAVGRGGANGTLNLSGNGSITKTGGGATIIGAGGFGTFNQSGGTFATTNGSETWIGEGGTGGTWNMTGGTASLARLDVGRNGSGTATLNVSGPAALTAGIVRFGESGSVVGIANLDGGSLQANQIVDGASSGASTINLNGGLLKAGESRTDWFQGLTAANVKAGGAKIDSNGFNVVANQNLSHDAALGATVDGGLVKSGAGSVTLGGTNTYTGTTTVNAGTLGFLKAASLYNNTPASWTASNIVVNAGTTLALGVGGPEAFTAADVDAIKSLGTATGGFKNGSNLGLDTTPGDFTYNSVIANTNGGANAIGFVKRGINTLTLGAANTYSGGTNVQAGTLALANVGALGTGGLAIANGATTRLQPGLPVALDLPSQPVMTASGATGGTLDITDGSMVIRHPDQAAAFAGHTTVNGLVRNAFNEFAWNQPGITSSTVAADIAAGIPAAVGILLNNDGGGNALFYGNGTDLPQFEGVSVDSNSVMTKYTLLGDGDLNGTVDSVDFALFQAGYTGAAPYIGFAFGDYDYNNVVDSVDFGLFQAGYEYSNSNPTPEMVAFADEHHLSLVAAAVPEPTTLGLLAVAGCGLLVRRRRAAR